jgi:uncharacterized protein (DUF1778 family)
MAKKHRRGRPKMDKGVSRAAVMTLRLQPTERKKVLAAAKQSRQKVSDWMRTALLAAADSITIEKPKAEGAGIQPLGD